MSKFRDFALFACLECLYVCLFLNYKHAHIAAGYHRRQPVPDRRAKRTAPWGSAPAPHHTAGIVLVLSLYTKDARSAPLIARSPVCGLDALLQSPVFEGGETSSVSAVHRPAFAHTVAEQGKSRLFQQYDQLLARIFQTNSS